MSSRNLPLHKADSGPIKQDQSPTMSIKWKVQLPRSAFRVRSEHIEHANKISASHDLTRSPLIRQSGSFFIRTNNGCEINETPVNLSLHDPSTRVTLHSPSKRPVKGLTSNALSRGRQKPTGQRIFAILPYKSLDDRLRKPLPAV